MENKGEIIVKILEVCQLGASKTVLVYGSHLNSRTVAPYLDSLMKCGLIAIVDGNPRKYLTTDKGKELLALTEKAQEFF